MLRPPPLTPHPDTVPASLPFVAFRGSSSCPWVEATSRLAPTRGGLRPLIRSASCHSDLCLGLAHPATASHWKETPWCGGGGALYSYNARKRYPSTWFRPFPRSDSCLSARFRPVSLIQPLRATGEKPHGAVVVVLCIAITRGTRHPSTLIRPLPRSGSCLSARFRPVSLSGPCERHGTGERCPDHVGHDGTSPYIVCTCDLGQGWVGYPRFQMWV